MAFLCNLGLQISLCYAAGNAVLQWDLLSLLMAGFSTLDHEQVQEYHISLSFFSAVGVSEMFFLITWDFHDEMPCPDTFLSLALMFCDDSLPGITPVV